MNVEAWLEPEPWADRYSVRMVQGYDGTRYHAETLTDGWIQYTEHPQGAVIPPFLVLRLEEVDALSAVFREKAKADDVGALSDARQTRDRLLSLIERRWS